MTKTDKPRVIARPTFYQWLRLHQDAGTKVGTTARWILADVECWPDRSKTLSHLVGHLRNEHAKDKNAPSEALLRAAYREFEEFLAGGGVVPKRARGDKEHRGYLLSPIAIGQIKELAKHEGVSQGSVIEKYIERAHTRAFGRQDAQGA